MFLYRVRSFPNERVCLLNRSLMSEHILYLIINIIQFFHSTIDSPFIIVSFRKWNIINDAGLLDRWNICIDILTKSNL